MDKSEKVESGNVFESLGLDARLVGTLAELGYEEPTPIQREAIPPLLEGKDVIGQAATGTGKTAAFALPMLQRIVGMGKERGMPSGLILVPTRELAMQVAEAMHKYGQKLKLTTIPIYGGHSFGQQQRMLQRGVDVVVGTPGRVVDHIKRGTMELKKLAILALDEADEMLDMGFAEDLETILSETPKERQTVFFSATLPPRIAGMVKRHLKEPVRIEIKKELTAKGMSPKVRQTAYIVPRGKKVEVLGRVLDLEDPQSALVFCRMRTEVDELTERLNAHGYRAQALHGGITQDQRSRVIKRLREGVIDLVVATDVAARGLDIENLELVVNFDVPTSPDSYVHRIGRVGRAGREGVAVTLADPRESRLLKMFERQMKGKIEIAQVPTVADMRARRLELTKAALGEAIAAGDLDHYRVVVESLAREHDLMEVALAAVKLLHLATGGEKDGEEMERDERPAGREGREGRENRPARREGKAAVREERSHSAGEAMARVYVGAGRTAGIRPGDLVGAIAGEAGIEGSLLGEIVISDRYSTVALPEDVLEQVVAAMGKALIKGKKVVVRRFVEK
ncbi:MAG TPA: DEAD/DEAH box helicase [Tepidisphaeraceae bacterium]|jgi:ATP-dependent RNA helicase DeaD|nr:DEAD/DEAH box helicase [Tepidisphaeraceae bacterium]